MIEFSLLYNGQFEKQKSIKGIELLSLVHGEIACTPCAVLSVTCKFT